jgi:hypothetical protein
MHPQIHINFVALAVSVVASFMLGNVWYGVIFRNVWCRAMGFENAKPSGAEIAKGSIINVFATFLVAFVMAHEVAIWRPTTWNLPGPDDSPAVYGFFAGLFCWLGFVVPGLLNGVAFERKSWKAFAINASFQLLSLQAIAMTLSYWR